MDTFPIVPSELEGDLTTRGFDLIIRFRDGETERVVGVIPEDPNARVRIVLRPFLEVEVTGGEGVPELTEIPLESVVSIDVDCREVRPYPPPEGEDESDYSYRDVAIPVARWACHPDRGLLRFVAQP